MTRPLPSYPLFRAKTRDLYQAATDSGEVLTASKSGVSTDKTLTHIDKTESSDAGHPGVKQIAIFGNARARLVAPLRKEATLG